MSATATTNTAIRAQQLYEESLDHSYRQIDRMFGGLLISQWIVAIVLALVFSPYAWSGRVRTIGSHVEAALFLGALFNALPLVLIRMRPGWVGTRMAIAVAQILWSCLLIHLTGGRLETHFHIFGSLAFLTFYRDWRVLIPATLVVVVDHFLRGIYWPESVYGITNPEWWRFLEHGSWILFLDFFLILACINSTKEMREIAMRRAETEQFAKELEGKTAQLSQAQRVARMGSWEWDMAADKINGSDELYRIFGINKNRTPTINMAQLIALIHPENRALIQQTIDSLRPQTNEFVLEYRIVLPNGEIRQILARGAARWGSDDKIIGLLGTAEDVTDRKELEIKLRQSEKLSAIGQLAGGIAHEINNPLAVILGFSQALDRRIPNGDPLRAPIEAIVREAIRCKDLVRELLTFSRTESKITEPLDLNELIRSTLVLIASQANMQNVVIKTELADDQLIFFANQTQIQQVLVNLSTNALDAMKSGGTLTFRTRGSAQEIALEVSDTGEGIPEKIRAKIFEPFFTTKEVGKGTGLGLSLVYEIVQQHRGSIDIDSKVGTGTIMSIKFPTKENREVS
jgi:signal transduction histidine kinase